MDLMINGSDSGVNKFHELGNCPEDENKSNSNVLSPQDICFLCNGRCPPQTPDIYLMLDILDAFFEETDTDKKVLLQYLPQFCPSCKSLFKSLMETKNALSTLVDEISSLIRQSKKISSNCMLSKSRVVNRLFQSKSLHSNCNRSLPEYFTSVLSKKETTFVKVHDPLEIKKSIDSSSSFSDQFEIIPDETNVTIAEELIVPSIFRKHPFCTSESKSEKPPPLQTAGSSINISPGSRSSRQSGATVMISNASGRFVLVKEPNNASNIMEENVQTVKDLSSYDDNVVPVDDGDGGEDEDIERERSDPLQKTIPVGTEDIESSSGSNKHKYICTICTKNFKCSRDLKNHIGSHKQEKPYICEICGVSYRQRRGLDVHVSLHRGEHRFECEHCHKVFTQKAGLQRHLPIHTGETAFTCEICGKGFLYHSSFAHHKLTHSGEKRFNCHICDQSFFSSSHLKRHIRTHSGERPFKCVLCERSFNEKFNLKSHLRVHSKTPAHQCPECQLGFNRKNKLTAHIAEAHV